MSKKYKELHNTWIPQKKEHFFVSYAVYGPTVPGTGLQAGLPVNHPINAPVTEPSPLNTRCMYAAPGYKPTCSLKDL